MRTVEKRPVTPGEAVFWATIAAFFGLPLYAIYKLQQAPNTVPPPNIVVGVTPPLTTAYNTSITLNANASGGTPPYTFAWDWGDGVGSLGPSSTHSYAPENAARTFTVTVTVTDRNGFTGQAQTALTETVIAPPVLTPPGAGNPPPSSPQGPVIAPTGNNISSVGAITLWIVADTPSHASPFTYDDVVTVNIGQILTNDQAISMYRQIGAKSLTDASMFSNLLTRTTPLKIAANLASTKGATVCMSYLSTFSVDNEQALLYCNNAAQGVGSA